MADEFAFDMQFGPPGRPSPKNIQVFETRNSPFADFVNPIESEGEIYFERSDEVIFEYRTKTGGGPSSAWAPLSFRFLGPNADGAVVAMGYEFGFEFHSPRLVKSKPEMKLGEATMMRWNLSFYKGDGELLVDLPNVFWNTVLCTKGRSQLIDEKVEDPRVQILWSTVKNQISSIRLRPAHRNFWFGFC